MFIVIKYTYIKLYIKHYILFEQMHSANHNLPSSFYVIEGCNIELVALL